LPPERISPVVLLVDREVAEAVASAPMRRFERRGLMFLAAIGFRGRGRLPNALRHEAARLNRAERLLESLQRVRLVVDRRQEEFPFLASMPRHVRPPDSDWSLYLRRCAWNFDDK
jgi:hypothetical protein